MSKEAKLYLFKDRKDYIKDLTDDDVINVIGLKGSGKTTSTLKYINDDNYIVINCDKLLSMPIDSDIEDKSLSIIKELLIDKYEKISEGKEFINCYEDIVEYAKDNNKKLLIEGNVLYDIEPITRLVGKVIIKRTGVVKCFFRTIKRDYPNKYFMSIEIEKHGKVLGKISRFNNIVKRRKKIFKSYHEIEKIIEEFERM